MDTRHKRKILYALSGLNVALALVAICASLLASPTSTTLTDAPAHPTALPTSHPKPTASLQSLSPLFALKLQRPLTPPQAQGVQRSLFEGRLIGTATSGASSQAMFQLANGEVELKSVGEDVAGARIQSITDNSVTLAYQGQPLILTLNAGAGQ